MHCMLGKPRSQKAPRVCIHSIQTRSPIVTRPRKEKAFQAIAVVKKPLAFCPTMVPTQFCPSLPFHGLTWFDPVSWPRSCKRCSKSTSDSAVKNKHVATDCPSFETCDTFGTGALSGRKSWSLSHLLNTVLYCFRKQ